MPRVSGSPDMEWDAYPWWCRRCQSCSSDAQQWGGMVVDLVDCRDALPDCSMTFFGDLCPSGGGGRRCKNNNSNAISCSKVVESSWWFSGWPSAIWTKRSNSDVEVSLFYSYEYSGRVEKHYIRIRHLPFTENVFHFWSNLEDVSSLNGRVKACSTSPFVSRNLGKVDRIPTLLLGSLTSPWWCWKVSFIFWKITKLSVVWLSKDMASLQASPSRWCITFTILWRFGTSEELSLNLLGGVGDPWRIFLWTVFKCMKCILYHPLHHRSAPG